MTNFTDYIVKEHLLNGGTQTIYKFPNGYGASVICGGLYTYGDDERPYELAVIKFRPSGDGFYLCYDTPITDDVVGYLTEDGVSALLAEIELL